MRYRLIFLLGLAAVLVPTIVRFYLLWPFPGSQELDSLRWAYALSKVVPVLQVAGAIAAAVGLVGILRHAPSRLRRMWALISVALAAGVFLMVERNSATAIFQPELDPTFARGTSEALPPETLVLGVSAGGVAKAYPLRLLAYHHQVTDELDGEPIWVTYCSMCRTGKVFRPVVDGRPTRFELVGALRYNSVYRDEATGSFWYQANGRAVAGPLDGATLPELPSDQMTLGRWLALHPESEVLQPDPKFAHGYELFGFADFDAQRSDPEHPEGWQWVVGVVHDGQARAYPWAELAEKRLLQDTIGELPIAIHLLEDGFSHRVWDRRVDGRVLELELDEDADVLIDEASGTRFGFDGVATGGELDGRSLRPVPSTVEYRHSFETFSGGSVAAIAPADP